MPTPQPVRETARAAQPVQQVVAAPNYVQIVKKNDDAVLTEIEKNPIYKLVIAGDIPNDKRLANVTQFLTAGLEDGTAKVEDLDARTKALTDFNAFIQVLRRQLGSEQAKEITSKSYADFQRILDQTSTDVAAFQDKLGPLSQLADLFTTYGANGNLIEKVNTAKAQKMIRDTNLTRWKVDHETNISNANRAIQNVEYRLQSDRERLAHAWIGKTALAGAIKATEDHLAKLKLDKKAIEDETPDETLRAAQGNEEQVDEGVLALQDIGGPKFKAAILELRDHTEVAMAKISANFDDAIAGLTNSRASFISMDRNCSDANMALSILAKAVKKAEEKAREIATGMTTEMPTDELDKMEAERRAETLLNYTSSLTTFQLDVNLAVTSLRSGQTVIQNILRMNASALQSSNTHKLTGMANTADAVTIIIGSIIDVCNRAASQALGDGLTQMRELAREGAKRLAGGATESLQMQNEQLQSFIDSVADLRTMTTGITANSVELLKEQFDLVSKMKIESDALSDATTDAQRTSFAARAGVLTEQKTDTPQVERRLTGLRIREGS